MESTARQEEKALLLLERERERRERAALWRPQTLGFRRDRRPLDAAAAATASEPTSRNSRYPGFSYYSSTSFSSSLSFCRGVVDCRCFPALIPYVYRYMHLWANFFLLYSYSFGSQERILAVSAWERICRRLTDRTRVMPRARRSYRSIDDMRFAKLQPVCRSDWSEFSEWREREGRDEI